MSAPVRPSLAALDALPDGVARPGYGPRRLSPGIVHVGVGNFHRAHMGVYLDRLHARGGHEDWGIVGAGVRPPDGLMRERLQPQDWMSTVVELDPTGLTARVTAPMCGFAEVASGPTVAAMSDPRVRIVSLTVTEGGYYTDAAGEFDADHPDIASDARGGEPRTVFGMILEALRARGEAGAPPFAVLSCDNLPGNGHAARAALSGLARLRGEEALMDGLATPNCMVDCIAPAVTEDVRAMVTERFGLADAAPVICEPFRQWVLEDDFPAGRPPLEEVGAEFARDVVPYELMKLRVLNAAHAAIAYPAALLGHHYVHDAVADPDIANWVCAVIGREAIPTLASIPGVDFHRYLDTCMERFANAAVADTVPRLAFDGSNRQPKFILPTVRDRLKATAPVDLLAMEVALWRLYCARAGREGVAPLEDERADALREAARGEPAAFLGLGAVFGDLPSTPFAAAFEKACDELGSDVRPALRSVAANAAF